MYNFALGNRELFSKIFLSFYFLKLKTREFMKLLLTYQTGYSSGGPRLEAG